MWHYKLKMRTNMKPCSLAGMQKINMASQWMSKKNKKQNLGQFHGSWRSDMHVKKNWSIYDCHCEIKCVGFFHGPAPLCFQLAENFIQLQNAIIFKYNQTAIELLDIMLKASAITKVQSFYIYLSVWFSFRFIFPHQSYPLVWHRIMLSSLHSPTWYTL